MSDTLRRALTMTGLPGKLIDEALAAPSMQALAALVEAAERQADCVMGHVAAHTDVRAAVDALREAVK